MLVCDGRFFSSCPVPIHVPVYIYACFAVLLFWSGDGDFQEGLSAFEGGEAMDKARTAVESLLREAQGVGVAPKDLDAAVIEVKPRFDALTDRFD